MIIRITVLLLLIIVTSGCANQRIKELEREVHTRKLLFNHLMESHEKQMDMTIKHNSAHFEPYRRDEEIEEIEEL